MNATLKQINTGIQIQQFDLEYIAKNWQLNDELYIVIHKCWEIGLQAMIQINHPLKRKNETNIIREYLSFAYDFHSKWVISLNGDCKDSGRIQKS